MKPKSIALLILILLTIVLGAGCQTTRANVKELGDYISVMALDGDTFGKDRSSFSCISLQYIAYISNNEICL